MNRLLLEELTRMKNLSLHERGRVISEQKIISEAPIAPEPLQPQINVGATKPQAQVQIGATAENQTVADSFRKWINTAPQKGYKCPDGRNLIDAPGRNFQGPCFKAAWAQYAQSFFAGSTSTASTETSTATTTPQDYYISQPNPSLEAAYSDVLKQIGGTGFTTFLYSKRDNNYEAIASNLPVDQLATKYGQSFSQYPNAATTIGAPANGVFGPDYVSQIKTFESSQTSTATTATTETITTPKQAEDAIAAAEAKAKELKAQTKMDKETCRTIGKAVNPVMPLKRGVTSPELCAKLHQCMDQGLLGRGDRAFLEACPKQETPAGGENKGEQKEDASMND